MTLEALQVTFGPEALRALVWITDWGGPLGWLVAFHVAFYLFGVRSAVFLGLVGLLALLSNAWLKWLWLAPRPYFLDPAVLLHTPTEGFGMPSGHAQGAAAIWLALVLLRRPSRWLLALVGLWIVAVGATRVLLGVHSPAQVAVGWSLGLFAVGLGVRFADPAARWFEQAGLGVLLSATLLGALLALGVTELVLARAADFEVPALWAQSYAMHAGADDKLSTSALLDPSPAWALVGALVGTMLVALLQRRWPVVLAAGLDRTLCLIVGVLVTIAFWWSAQASGIGASPAALLLPLLYPAICGFLPVWLVCNGRRQR